MSTATAAAETATIIWGTTGAAFYCPGASGFAQGSPLAPILDVGGPGVLADPGPFLFGFNSQHARPIFPVCHR